MNKIVNEFIDKQKSAGITDEDIQKTVYIALNYATIATINEIKGKMSPEIKKILSELSKHPKDSANILYQEDFMNARLEGSDEIISQVVDRHLKDFFEIL